MSTEIEYLRQEHSEPEIQAAITRAEQRDGHSFALVERSAYWSYRGYRLEFGVGVSDLEEAVRLLDPLKNNQKITQAGHATLNSGPKSDFRDPTEDLRGESNSAPWLVWLLIDRGMDKYWSFIMPSILNMVDSSIPKLKISGAKLAQFVAQKRPDKLRQVGLVMVFQDALTLLLSYLPPSTDPDEAALINSAAQAAMLELASSRQDYNFLAVKAFGALEHARGNVEFTRSILSSLEKLVQRMQINAVAHLRQIINIFNAIAGDPFADMSPELLADAVSLMATTIKACSPRVAQYRYNILLGVIKGKLWESSVASELSSYLSEKEMADAKYFEPTST